MGDVFRSQPVDVRVPAAHTLLKCPELNGNMALLFPLKTDDVGFLNTSVLGHFHYFISRSEIKTSLCKHDQNR